MLKLDNNLLQELGLGALPDEQKRSMLQHIYETLELRVGTRLANQMTDQQLEEFEKFIDAGGDNNQAQALQWLETNLPKYKQVVNDVFEELKVEVKQMAPQIMASSAQPQVQPAQPVDPAAQQYAQPPQPVQPMQPAQPQPVQPQQPVQPVQDQPQAIPQQPVQPQIPPAPQQPQQFQPPQYPNPQQPPAGPQDDQQPPQAA